MSSNKSDVSLRARFVMALCVSAALSGTVWGQKTKTDLPSATTSATASKWFDAGTWSPAGLPTASDDVVLGGVYSGTDDTSLFFTVDAGGTAVARSLRVDALVPVGAVNDSTLTFNALASPVEVTNFAMGTLVHSQVLASLGSFKATDATAANVLGDAGGSASATVTSQGVAGVPDLDVAGRLRVGNSLDADSGVSSLGELRLNEGALARVGGNISVGREGGIGRLHGFGGSKLEALSNLIVGASGASLSDGSYVPSDGELELSGSFVDGAPAVVSVPNGRFDIATNTLDNLSSAASGTVSAFISRIEVGVDSTNASMVIGRGVVVDGNGIISRSTGQLSTAGSAFVLTPNPLPALETAGTVFVGLEGGDGSLTADGSWQKIGGDVVVGSGTKNFNNTTVASTGTYTVNLNSKVEIARNIFIGTDGGIGTFTAVANGDGGSTVRADYVSVGNGGTGKLQVDGMNTVRVNNLEIFTATALANNRAGGTVELGIQQSQSATLSTVDFHANGEGDRFDWQGGRFDLRGGRVYDWGENTFTIPAQGIFSGYGKIETSVENNGLMQIGLTLDSYFYNATLEVTQAFTSLSSGTIEMLIFEPTRINGGAFQTIIIDGDATFDGTLTVSSVFNENWNVYTGANVLPGDTFQLFSYGGLVSGTFSTLNLPTLPEYLYWDTSHLYTDGTIIVAAIPEPTMMASLVLPVAFAARRRR